MSNSNYHVYAGDGYPYFFTCTVIDWIKVFTNDKMFTILLDSLRFLIDENRISLHGYILMKDHLHLVASGEDLAKNIGNYKSFTARTIIDLLKQNNADHHILGKLAAGMKQYKTGQQYQLWQEGSHPQCMGTQKILNQKLDYIHFNPVRAGYVDEPEKWKYSSYRDYMGEPGFLPIEILS